MRLSSKIAYSALIGAAYAALSLALQPISFGPVQLRLSEALCVLPYFFPFAAPGLFTGCFIANFLGTGNILDMVFGSLATLAAAFLTSKCKSRFLAPLPPVLINAVVVGIVIAYSASPANLLMTSLIYGGQIFVSQAIVCYGLGLPLLGYLDRHKASIMGCLGLTNSGRSQ